MIRNSQYLLLLMVLFLSQTSRVAGQENLFQQAIEQTQQRMVKVIGAGAGNVEGYATGMLISDDGLILSTQGVFLDGPQVQIILPDGSLHTASVLRRNRQLQLSLLKIEAPTPDHFTLGSEDFGQQGDWVAAVSNAYKIADKEEHLSVMMGVISLRTTIDAKLNQRDTAYSGPLVLVDAITSNPGAAGGAIIDRQGNLVGLIGKIIDSSETNTRLNYAVPRSLLDRFAKGELSTEPLAQSQVPRKRLDLGLKIFQLSGRNAPPYIDKVVAGGLAAQAGLKSDDMVVSINGNKVKTVRDYQQQTSELYDDQQLVIVAARKSKLVRAVVWEPNPVSPKSTTVPGGQGNE